MSTIVDHVFPPTDAHSSPSMALDYSSFTFWREPMPRIVDASDDVEAATTAVADGEKVDEKDHVMTSATNNAKETETSSSSSSSQTTIVETITDNEK